MLTSADSSSAGMGESQNTHEQDTRFRNFNFLQSQVSCFLSLISDRIVSSVDLVSNTIIFHCGSLCSGIRNDTLVFFVQTCDESLEISGDC
jgi:hypothetical protein